MRGQRDVQSRLRMQSMASLDSAVDSLPSIGDVKPLLEEDADALTAARTLTRNISLGQNPSELWKYAFAECRNDVVLLLARLTSLKKNILRAHEICDQIDRSSDKADGHVGYTCNLPNSLLGNILKRFVQEAIVLEPVVAFSLRPAPGRYTYVRMSAEDTSWEELTVAEYLQLKERIVDAPADPYTLEVDMGPFQAHFPSMQRYEDLQPCHPGYL